MKRLLLPLIAALALPTTVNAGFSFDEKRETCARYFSGQIPTEEIATKFDIKKPQYPLAQIAGRKLSQAVKEYCWFFRGHQN